MLKTKDIVVGQKYAHPQYKEFVYLGCGTDRNNQFVNKRLVIVEGPDSWIGRQVKLSNKRVGDREFSSGFYKI